MKRCITYFALTLMLLFAGKTVMSQKNYATNVSKSLADEKLLISYDLVQTDEAKSFSVVLFITSGGSQVKTSSAYGDVGNNVSPGREKAIVWYYKDDFDGDIGNVSVEVLAYKENEPQAIFKIVSVGNNGYAPCEVVFSNNSSYANEYQWNFGDPTSSVRNLSFEKDARHIYENGGVFSISLTARNTQLNMESTYYQSIEIKTHDPVTAGFDIINNNQLPPVKVSFKNTSENADSYRWNFGDPSLKRKNESDSKEETVKYKNAGTFKVQLIVKNNFSGLTDTITKDVVVESEKVAEAGFIYTRSSETAPSTVTFKNTSGNAERYRWDFADPSSGDKNSSEETDPAHLFSEPGTYKVQLSAWGKGMKKPDTFSEVITIKELPKPPEARFSVSNNNMIGPVTVIFNNNSLNATRFSWDFGDPESGNENTSDKKEPSHTYKKGGRYKVVLTASSPGFSRESVATDWVVVTSPSVPEIALTAKFIVENNNNPAPAIVKFTDSSSNADSFSWDFGDPGSDENTSVLKNPVHIYSEEGRYKVTLTVKNDDADKTDTFTDFVVVTGQPEPVKEEKSAEVEEVAEVQQAEQVKEEVVVPPVAGFNIEISEGENVAPARIIFSNTSENADSFAWDFGDPSSGSSNVSIQKNPEHVFQNPGEYKVTLAVLSKSSGKEDVFEKTVVVSKPKAPPIADFEINLKGEFTPLTAEFKNLSSNADTYKWNFGDFDSNNNESTALAPSHYYQMPGNYIVTLEATNSESGEVAQASKEISFKSSYSTYIKSDDFDKENENVLSLVNLPGNEYLAVMKKDGKGSSVLKLDNSGKITGRKDFDFYVYEIIPMQEATSFMMVGLDPSGKLLIMEIDPALKTGEPVYFQENQNFKTDFAYPQLALAVNNELGIAANTVGGRYPLDISFQKADKSGRIVPFTDRTFKYVGNKMFTDIIPTSDGGFALTGYWQEKDKSPLLILFGRIDRRAHGDIHLISSEMNIIGCDIENSYQGGFAILRGEEIRSNMYEISFTLVDKDGGPTDCANLLPCSVKSDDVLRYKPSMVKIDDGYAIASHSYSGSDYDITLYWVDKSGNELIRYEVLSLPGDQFVMDLVKAEDGGYLVAGTQKVNGKMKALIIKTDPWGKLNK